mgnify:CR=1 FL=1
MKGNEDFLNFFKEHAGIGPSGYLCTKCKIELERIMVKTTVETPRKLFFCLNKQCVRFGVVTVVAIKK